MIDSFGKDKFSVKIQPPSPQASLMEVSRSGEKAVKKKKKR